LAHVEEIEQPTTHRLVPSKYSTTGSVLESLRLPSDVLSHLSELDAATNERKLAEGGGWTGIGPNELLFGVPQAQIVNAAFCHPGPYGGRFHGPQRGAWYAAFDLETSIAEVSFHKRRFLQEAHITGEHEFEYVDFLADFSGEFHHLDNRELDSCLKPAPVPQCYAASQALASSLLYAGSNGIVYPSVRRPSGTCIACFRPALVFHPRRSGTYLLTLQTSTAAVSFTEISRT
jgi:RES domain-containing protein